MKKKILVLLIGNIRYDGRVKKEISSLQKFGYEVSLICTAFDHDDDMSNYNFPIYIVQRPSGTSVINKITNKLKYKREINKLIKKIEPDYLHCNDATIFYVSKWIKKIKVIYDAHELLPQMKNGIRRTITTFLERQKLNHVHKVILPQIDRLNYFYFQYRNQIRKSQLFLIENFPLETNEIIPNYFHFKYNFQTDNIILSYVGAISKERSILSIVEAVSMIDNLIFFVIGRSEPDYKKKVFNLIKEKKVQNRVFVKDSIPNNEVISVSESSDIGICFYSDPNLNSYFCASNKLYENLNSGAAVLTNNIAGTARIIKDGINGFAINEISVDEIYNGLKKIINIDSPTRSTYFWENQEDVLQKIYS